MSRKNLTFITSVLLLIGSVANAATQDLSRFAGSFVLQQGGPHCPVSMDLTSSDNAHDIAFQIWELTKIQMPARYRANARISTDAISQAVYSSGLDYYLHWTTDATSAGLTVRIGYWRWNPTDGPERFERFVEMAAFACRYERR